jgi:HPt (histidine-containing phosphotransfer) domain-containing protein
MERQPEGRVLVGLVVSGAGCWLGWLLVGLVVGWGGCWLQSSRLGKAPAVGSGERFGVDSREPSGGGEEAAAIAAALDRMWVKFVPDLLDRVGVLEAAARVLATGELTDELRQQAQAAAHKLAGSLGTFGLGRGTELARMLEGRWAAGGLQVSDAEELGAAAAEIRALIGAR